METKVSILGTDYIVHIGVTVAEDASLADRLGYCMPTARKIVVVDMNDVENWKDESEECKNRCVATTLRHEVIHAFLAESGLWSCSLDGGAWAMNEEMIDWLAMQWPKINRIFDILGCKDWVYK